MNKMARSAHGLSSPGGHWTDRAACEGMSDLFFLDGDSEEHKRAGQAVHICITHCRVLAECAEAAAQVRPISMVQAGVRYGAGPTRPAQPNDPGCGPWCREARGQTR